MHPVRLLGLGESVHPLGVDIPAFRELLAPALDIAERHDGFEVPRIGGNDLFETRFRLIGAIERIQVQRELDLRVALKR